MENSSTFDSSLYSTSSMGSSGDAGAAALMFGVLGFTAVLTYVIGALFMGMMFKKAGIPAWKAWVPVYNSWTFLEMGGQKGWLSLLLLLSWIPFVGLVPFIFMCIAAYRIGLGFGKEAWFVVIYILLGPVWLIWLAVDKTAVWQPAAAGVSPVATPLVSAEPQPAAPQSFTPPPADVQAPDSSNDTPQQPPAAM